MAQVKIKLKENFDESPAHNWCCIIRFGFTKLSTFLTSETMQDVCRVYKEVGTGQVTIQQPPPAFKPSENLKPLAPVNSKKVEENPPRENVRLLREMRFFVKTKMRIFDFVRFLSSKFWSILV